MSENTSESNQSEQSQQQTPQRGFQALQNHVIQNKVDVALWATRMLTIIFAMGYILPIFGNAQNAYYKVLMANAATSALRLHQRMPSVTFTKEYVAKLLAEDSCHYLFFSLIYLYVSPVLLIIFPVVIFAVLHTASYSLTLLDLIGQNSIWPARLLISIVELQTRNMLRLAAFAEVLLMPLAIILVFMGQAGIMTPFVYYHFLVLRYSSRRNPHTRHVFAELKLTALSIANKPTTPGILKKALHFGISVVTRLSPVENMPQQQHGQ